MVESTRPRINTHINLEEYRALYYGYQWWLGRSLLSGHDLPLIAGFGNGGQRLFVVPELDLVVAINALLSRSAQIVQDRLRHLDEGIAEPNAIGRSPT